MWCNKYRVLTVVHFCLVALIFPTRVDIWPLWNLFKPHSYFVTNHSKAIFVVVLVLLCLGLYVAVDVFFISVN